MNRKFITCLTIGALVLSVTTLGAQYSMSVGGTTSSGAGGTVEISVFLSSDAGTAGPMSGWSYGVCHDEALLSIPGPHPAAPPSFPTSNPNNASTVSVNGGALPGFESLVVQGLAGYTHGVVIDLFGNNPLPPGTTNFEMTNCTYDVLAAGPAPGDPPIVFPGAWQICATLGSPAVAAVVVVAGASIPPAMSGADLTVIGDPCDVPTSFDYMAPNSPSIGYPAASGIGGVGYSAAFAIAETSAYPAGEGCANAETQGFSMGVSHDPALLSASNVHSTLPFVPGFESPATFANGWTIGVVYSLVPPVQTLPFAGPTDVVGVDYTGNAGALAGVVGSTTTALTWDSGLGSPPVANVVVVGGASLAAGFVDGSVTFNGTEAQPFVAGDCNGDGIDNIADVIWGLYELHLGGPSANCALACDTNGDGNYDTADPVYNAMYIFNGGPPPVGPAPGMCATVPGQTFADCEQDNCS